MSVPVPLAIPSALTLRQWEGVSHPGYELLKCWQMGMGRLDRHRWHPKAVPVSRGMSGGGPILVGIGIGVGAISLYTQAEEEGPHASPVALVQCGVGSMGKAGA